MIRLDEYQIEAVKAESRNTLVVAAPGAGKTTVILNRIAYLMHRKGVASSNIIVITFTKAAAQNMKDRFNRLYPSLQAPFFGTFHALFYKILARTGREIKIITDRETFYLVKKVLAEHLDEVSDEKVKDVLNDMSLARSKQEEIKPSISKEIFKDVQNKYSRYKEEKGLMDFDDLQIECIELLKSREDLLNGYKALFRHILVDEYQDCDLGQNELLKLFNTDNSIFAVGDEDQCIYGFRGSRPDFMVDFCEVFEDAKKVYLENNYRCPNNIVGLSKDLIKNNKMRNEKNINAARESNGDIAFITNIDERAQAKKIAGEIKKLKEVGGEEYTDNTILYRTNMESRALVSEFMKNDIPFTLLDKKYNFFNHFVCKDLIAYLKLSINPYDKESFSKIINKPFRYVGKDKLYEMKGSNASGDCFEVLKNLPDMHPRQMKNIDKLRNDILYLNKVTASSAVEVILTSLGYLGYLEEYCSRYKMDVEELVDITNEFKDASKDFKKISEFLTHIEEFEENLNKKVEEAEREQGVLLSTIHGVKGMEFKNVFILNVNEGCIPHSNSSEEKEKVEEERRLFYVGVTRAEDKLYISKCYKVKGKDADDSRFLAELPQSKGSSSEDFKVGESVVHAKFGRGTIIEKKGTKIDIEFESGKTGKYDILILQNKNLITR